MPDIHFKLTADDSDVVSKINQLQNKVSDVNSKLSRVDIGQLDSAISTLTQQVQIQKTVVAALEDEYKKLGQEVKKAGESSNYEKQGELTAQYGKMKREIEGEQQALKGLQTDLANTKMLRQQVSQVMKEQSAAEKEIAEQSKATAQSNKELGAAIGTINPELTKATSGIKKMVTAAKSFIATPLGAVIAAIAAALSTLKSYFTRSAEGQMEFARVSGYLKGVLDQLREITIKVGETLVKAFKDPKQAIHDLWTGIKNNLINRLNATKEFFASFGEMIGRVFHGDWEGVKESAAEVGKAFVDMQTGVKNTTDKIADWAQKTDEAAKKTAELAVSAKQLELAESRWLVEAAKLEEKKNEARMKLYDTNLSEDERKAAAEEYKDAVNAWAEGEKNLLRLKYKDQKEQMKIITNSIEDMAMLNELEAAIIRVDAQAKSQLASMVRRTNTLYKDENAEEYNKYVENLVKKYNEYAKTREDIEEDFSKRIGVIQAERVKAIQAGDKEQVRAFDEMLDKIYKDRGTTLIKFDFEQLKKDPEYVKAFENLDYTSSETLNHLVGRLEELKAVAAETLDPTELQAYTQAIEKIEDELASRNPFKALKDAYDELQEALKSGDVNSISKAQEKYNKALNKSINLTDELTGAIASIGQQIGGEIGNVLVFISDIGNLLTVTISGINDLSKSGAQALTAIEKASVVLSVASAAISVFNKIKASVEAHREEIERAEQAINSYRNAVRLAALDIQGDYDTIFGTDKFGRYQEALQKSGEALTAFKDKLKDTSDLKVYQQQEQLFDYYASGVYSLQGSNWNALFDDYKGIIGGLEEVKGLFMIDFGDYNSLLEFDLKQYKEGASTIFNWIEDEYGNLSLDQSNLLDVENLKTWFETMKSEGEMLSEKEQDYIQGIIDTWEKYEDAMEEVKSYVSDIFGDIASDMTDTFFDSIENSADAWQDWEQTGRDAVKNVAKQWLQSELITQVLNKYSDLISNAVAANDTAGLQELMDKVVSEGGAFLESYKETFEWLSSGEYQQEASTGAFQSMSQATGDELNGRFTALQIAGENISQSMIAGIAELKAIASMGANMSSNIYNILTQQVKANTFLEDIQKYTRQCAAFQSDITRIANKIQTL